MGTKTLWRSEEITGQEGVWRVARKTLTNGGDNDPNKEGSKTPQPHQKGKPPKLLQQSGGTPRSEKRRLHLRTV